MSARVGTMQTPAEHFAEWKEMGGRGKRTRSQLQMMIDGVSRPHASWS